MRALSLSVLLLVLAGPLAAQEICNNAVDDDGDGAIDLNDPDCACFGSLNSGVPSLIPNRSFEEQICCPFGFVSMVSPPWLSCAEGWRPGTQGTTDYFHSCGYMPEPMVVRPVPDGEGVVGVYPGVYTGIGDESDLYFEYLYRGGAGFVSLQPGTSYTLEVWFAPTSSDGQHEGSAGNFYDGAVRMALIGDLEGALAPLDTLGCLGSQPGWTELAVADLGPSTTWQRIRFDFTPQQEIRGIALGGSCEQPFPGQKFVQTITEGGHTTERTYDPYVLIDDLVLNTSDQFQPGITTTGAWCTNDLVLNATLTAGATEGQWYLNGVALIGETFSLLDLSGAVHDGGLYSFTQQGAEDCTRHDLHVPMRPAFTFRPDTGYVPLEVIFIAADGQSGIWDLGDGSQLEGDTVVHTYTGSGTFTVSLQQDILGCPTTTTHDDAVLVWPLVPLQIIATPQPTDVNDTEITLVGEGPAGIVSWQWDLGEVQPLTAEGQQITVEFPAEAGSYPVMLVVSGDLREAENDTTYYDVVILPALGIDRHDALAVTLLPNPVQDRLYVQVPFRPERWRMLDALGQMVQQGRGDGDHLMLDTRSLRAGSYLLVLDAEEQAVQVRFVKD
ncbi:MAG: hypothetical protein JST66_09765 [Bacteroidetes bacterium]|nr:hypothetical protein [Bacteroidota bacterium]